MTQEFRDKSYKSESRPKSLGERLQWMADNLPGFREELELVGQAQRSSTQPGRITAQQDVSSLTGERA
ncbi:hypothetical protein [Pseudomonas sp.]|uniref:hypothetical protein n=1 Tax=Pseudomonas sp. TaxID=306 RepID=UPI00260B8765|nr:hypothetical protein [Pseudomonas sp.]